jgi:hypothetical protein
MKKSTLMLPLYFSEQRPIQITLSFLSLFNLLSIFNIAEARTISSGMFFQGNYKNKHIYGSLNSWDNRACTVVNNKIILGRVSDDSKTVMFPRYKAKSIEIMMFNPAGASKIPTSLINSSKFQECIQKTMYAKCFVKAGVEYYKSDDTAFRGVIKTRTPIFSMGTDNNSYNRGEKVDSWAWLSFKSNSGSTTFIVNEKNLDCRSK